jgi:hypothetical protein
MRFDADNRRADTALTDEEEDDRDIATLPNVENAVAEERELTTNADVVDGVYNDSDLGADVGFPDVHQPRGVPSTEASPPDEEMDQDGEGI